MMPKGSILLFRHGETQWNRSKRIQGQTDSPSPLTLRGVDQARAYGHAVAELLGPQPDSWRIIGSPLSRCVQTLSILCDSAGLDFDKVELDDRLKEVDTGLYSGLLRSELETSQPELFGGSGGESWYFRCVGGETLDDLARRLGGWLSDRDRDERILVVTHGVAGKVLRGLYQSNDPGAALAEDSPQDAFFILSEGRVERRSCESW